jgi:ketopantoate reductase
VKYTVFGAGSVGTVLAGLLADAQVPVAIAGRGAVPGLRLEGDAETVEARVPVVAEPLGTILLCVHGPDVPDLCRRWPGRSVVTFQNGVRSEAAAARWCRVIGGVWRMTCTLMEPGRALFTRRGRVIVGRHPEGVDAEVESLAADLRRARFDVGVSPRIERDKWLKLFLNLASTAHAIVRREDHGKPGFGRLKAAILEEARDLFAKAGIVAVSCDGRDAALDEEIERHRTGGGRARPVYNSTWRLLSRGLRPKERYHDTVMALGPAPRNAAMLRLLDRALRPECYTVDEALSEVCGT